MNTLSKITKYIAIFALIISVIMPSAVAFAAVPTLSLTSYGSGTNQVQIVVNGDQNQNINLYYYNPVGSSNLMNAGVIGTTNASGYFSTTLNTGSYNIPSGTTVFVTVNGQQSSTAIWPSTTGGNVYLSQTNITLSSGQSYNVSISGGSTNGYYVSTNTNANAVTTSLSGSVLTINGVNSGSANITVCSLGSTSACATLYVTVNGGYYNNGGSISLSQNSITLNQGQSQTVTIYNSQSGSYYNNYNTYYVSSNSNSGAVTASINGNTINIYGANTGYSSLTICSYSNGTYNTSSCANLYVTVNSYYGYPNNNNTYTNYPTYPYSYPYTYYNNTYTPTYTPSYSYTPSYTYSSGQPVSGVFLSQVPATGAGDMIKITLFILAILVWSAFVAYMLNSKSIQVKSLVTGFSAKGNNASVSLNKIQQFKADQMRKRGLNQ